MKAYIIKATGKYCGGMAVVIAHNAEQAMQIAQTGAADYFGKMIDWTKPNDIFALDDSLTVKRYQKPILLSSFTFGE